MKTVFFDIDTQIDFVYPAGALYVPGSEKILPVIAQLNRKAPIVISTMDAHSENDPEFQIYPHHCVAGTVGQQKAAVTLIEKKLPPGFSSLALLDLPLVLLVPKDSKITSADELWKRDKISEPLICLPTTETLTKSFLQRLGELEVDWFPGIEVSSVNLVEAYVARGYGIGLSIALPQTKPNPNVRQLLLHDFPTVTIGALWAGKPTPLTTAFVDAAQQHAKQLAART